MNDSSVFRPKRDNAYCTVKTSLKSILRGLDGTKEVIQDIGFDVIWLLHTRTNSYVSIVYISSTIDNLFLHSMRSSSYTQSKHSGLETRGGRNPPMQISNQSWMHSTSAISILFSIMTRNMIFETSHTTFPTSFVKCIQPSITIWKSILSNASFGSSTWRQESASSEWQKRRRKRNGKNWRTLYLTMMKYLYRIGTRLGMQRIDHAVYPPVGKRAFRTIRKQIQVDTWFTACIWIGAWRSKDLGSSSHLVFVQALCHITQLLTLRLWSHSLQKKEKRQTC